MRNNRTALVMTLAVLLFNGIYAVAQTYPIPVPEFKWANEVGAKTMPTGKKTYLVSAYGAKNDGITLNTKSIQAAIDACAAKGGGIVTFDTGKYVTGSIFLKKNVNLQISKGVTILGSQDIADYPDIDTRAAGIEIRWPAAIINIINIDNAAITGEGTVHGRGKIFWDKYWTMRKEYDPKGLRWIVDYDCKRPRSILVQNSSNITVKGISILQAGFWSLQIVYSKNVTASGITVRNNIDGKGPSTDGIDVDSSSYILVENSDVDCNDDDFCLKAGRDADGLRVNRPCEYVVIRNCISRSGGGTLVCGSETSGSIRHVLAYNIKAIGSSSGLRIKSAANRGGTVEDINVYNLELENSKNALVISMNWNPTYSYSTLPPAYNYDSIPHHWKVMLAKVTPEQGLPHFRNVTINGVKGVVSNTVLDATGMKESYAENFSISNVDVSSHIAGKLSFCKNWKLENVIIKSRDNSKLSIDNCIDINL
jgi:polygalacturonase